MEALRGYDARVDSKNRVTLRGARYKYYHVRELKNGCYILEPRELKAPEEISARTLRDMDEAVANLKVGNVSGPIDLSDFEQRVMPYQIRMGIPEMRRLWNDLQQRNRAGTATKDELQIYQKQGKAMRLLSQDPRHPGLRTHEIEPLSKRYGMRVWQSYLENRNSRAMRMYWVYGPGKGSITIIGLELHPEDKKNGAYDRVSLSELPPS